MTEHKADKMCFAILHKLKSRLKQHNLTAVDYWNYAKAQQGIESKREFTQKNWVYCAARLNASQPKALCFSNRYVNLSRYTSEARHMNLEKIPTRAHPTCTCPSENYRIITREYGTGMHYWICCGTCDAQGLQAVSKRLIQATQPPHKKRTAKKNAALFFNNKCM